MPFDPISYDLASKKAAKLHASQHALGGSDRLSLDASQITSGRLSLSRLPTSATANQYLVVRTANADPVWDVIKLSDLSIDTDKDWGGRSIIGLYNVSLRGTLNLVGARTEIIGFDGSGYHWIRSVSGSDTDLFMGFQRLGDGDVAIIFSAPIDSTILPKVDNRHSLGSSSLRWANVYAVNVYTGDLKFANDWVMTERDDNGNVIEGIRILNRKGEEIFKITEDGLWFKGKKIA